MEHRQTPLIPIKQVLAVAVTVFALSVGIASAIIGVGISLVVTLLPLIIVGYLVW
ncbi:hypothetical protein GCM10027181_03020 [Rheinheimera gaetbuli]